MQYITQYLSALWTLTAEMSPYLLLGFLFAGLLKVYFPQKKMIRYMGHRNMKSVVNGSLLGIPLPLCSCGVIPTGVSFYRNGASKGATLSFLISTPQTGVDSILATYALLGWPFAIIRPFVALVTGLFGGWVGNKTDTQETIPTESYASESNKVEGNRFMSMLYYAFVEFLQDIMQWLVIGLLIAAVIAVAIPDDFFSGYVGNGYLGMLVMLVAAVPLYVCATASVPIAAVLLMKGLAPGAVLVFLMAGPATNAATIAVLSNALGRKTFVAYLATIVAGALFFGTFINEFLPREWFSISSAGMHIGHEHHLLPVWFDYTCAVGLIVLIINGYYRKNFVDPKNKAVMENHIEISVKGMECKHCKANVEQHLAKVEGVEEVVADFQNDTVKLKGKVDLTKIQEIVDGLGYKYDGVVHNVSFGGGA